MSDKPITTQIRELGPWFHNLHLPGGEQTAPHHILGDFPRWKWQQIAPFVPKDLSGTHVLDIGCNAGFYSFELARRGAVVRAIDIDGHYLQQAVWAASLLGLQERIEFRRATVYQLLHDARQYDLIWFMGVLYHLRYPMLALDLIRNRCHGRVFFQTMTMPGDDVLPVQANYELHQREVMNHPGWPKMAFIEHRIANDPTNWWAPNRAAVEAMLRAAGFASIQRIAHEIYTAEASGTPAGSSIAELWSAAE